MQKSDKGQRGAVAFVFASVISLGVLAIVEQQGVRLAAAALVAAIAIRYAYGFMRNASRTKKKRAAIGLVVVLVLASIVPLHIATYDSQLAASAKIDAAIVLGAAIYRERPSPVFAARLDYARDLIREQRVGWVIVTGGYGEGEKHSEAEVGRRYLVARGVDAKRVLVETKSRTTFQNICNAAAISRERGFHRHAIVSDPLHMRRAMQLATDAGLLAMPAATPYTRYRSYETRLPFLARESYFYARRRVLGRAAC